MTLWLLRAQDLVDVATDKVQRLLLAQLSIAVAECRSSLEAEIAHAPVFRQSDADGDAFGNKPVNGCAVSEGSTGQGATSIPGGDGGLEREKDDAHGGGGEFLGEHVGFCAADDGNFDGFLVGGFDFGFDA